MSSVSARKFLRFQYHEFDGHFHLVRNGWKPYYALTDIRKNHDWTNEGEPAGTFESASTVECGSPPRAPGAARYLHRDQGPFRSRNAALNTTTGDRGDDAQYLGERDSSESGAIPRGGTLDAADSTRRSSRIGRD